MFIQKVLKPGPASRMFGKLSRQKEFTQARLHKEEQLKQEKLRAKAFPVIQYPENLDDKNTIIFDPNENQEYITPKNHVEVTFYDDSTQAGYHMEHVREGLNEKIKETKIGYGLGLDNTNSVQMGQCVTFVGLPNSGKSSLLNSIADQEITAVSNKAHTTNENMMYVKNFITAQDDKASAKLNIKRETNSSEQENIQLVMYDTPGLLSFKNSDKNKMNTGWDAVNEADTIVLVVDCLRRINQDLIDIVKELSKYPEKPPSISWDIKNNKAREIILVLSKVDLCNNKRKLYGLKTELEDYLHFSKVFITSAETGFGTEELQDYLKTGVTKREHQFQKIQVSEMTELEILEESCRQAVFNNYYEELPHRLEVEINELSVQATGKVKMQVTIFGFKRVHKGIIIGRNGRNVNRLKREIAKSFMQRFGLECDVWINVGKRINSVHGLGQELHFRGNRKLVNENSKMIVKNLRKAHSIASSDAKKGFTKKREVEQQFMQDVKGHTERI